MAKFTLDKVLDQALSYLESNVDQIVLCSGQPSNYSDATTDFGSGGNALGEASIGSSDVTLADGDTSGRKATVSAQSGIDVDVEASGGDQLDHYALINDTDSELLHVTDAGTNRDVFVSDAVDTDAFDIEFQDPS